MLVEILVFTKRIYDIKVDSREEFKITEELRLIFISTLNLKRKNKNKFREEASVYISR